MARERDFACGLNETGMRKLIADVEQELRLPKDKRLKEDQIQEIFDGAQFLTGGDAVRNVVRLKIAPLQQVVGKYKKGM